MLACRKTQHKAFIRIKNAPVRRGSYAKCNREPAACESTQLAWGKAAAGRKRNGAAAARCGGCAAAAVQLHLAAERP